MMKSLRPFAPFASMVVLTIASCSAPPNGHLRSNLSRADDSSVEVHRGQDYVHRLIERLKSKDERIAEPASMEVRRISGVIGYDFRYNPEALGFWFQWAVDRDPKVITACLASEDLQEMRLGVDIAVSSDDRNARRLVTSLYERDTNPEDRRIIRDAVAERSLWRMGMNGYSCHEIHRFSSGAMYSGTRVLIPNAKGWAAIASLEFGNSMSER